MAGVLSILPDPPQAPAPIGVIAGGGDLPIFVANGLKKMGYQVHGIGLHAQYEPELPGMCDSFCDVGLLRMRSWGKRLRRRGVHHAIMVGKVDKAKLMHQRWKLVRNIPDVTTLLAWYKHLRHDRRSHAVLRVIADELDNNGVALIDSTFPIMDQLSEPGVMTSTKPSANQRADIEFVPVAYDYRGLAQDMRDEGLPAEFIETVETGWPDPPEAFRRGNRLDVSRRRRREGVRRRAPALHRSAGVPTQLPEADPRIWAN